LASDRERYPHAIDPERVTEINLAESIRFPPLQKICTLLSSRGRRFQSYMVGYLFRKLAQRLNLNFPCGAPTFYSLRHSFAVRRLVAWYRDGVSVQTRLPALATYMGHVHYTSTSYYLTATAELLGIAADRLGTVLGSRVEDE
jgi:integrase